MQVLHDLLGVGWVVLDRYKMPGGPERDVTTDYAQQIFAGQTPIYEDERLTVYRVTEPAQRGPYLILAPDWAPRQSDEAGTTWRDLPAGQSASFEVISPSGDPLGLEIEAAARAGGKLVLMDAAGEVLASWELGPEVATVRTGPLKTTSVAPTALQLIYENQSGASAAIHRLSVTPAQ